MLEDADIDRAAQTAVKSRFLNTGQGCIAAKRFIVAENIIADFTKAFELEILKLKIGDPMDEETDIGPVAKKEFVESLEKILTEAKKKGAEPRVYGTEYKKGFFFRPTLIPATCIDMEVCNMEVFGPIAPLIMVKNEDEAVKIANSIDFGLGAEVWSGDLERAEKLAKRIRSGFVASMGWSGPIHGCLLAGPRSPESGDNFPI